MFRTILIVSVILLMIPSPADAQGFLSPSGPIAADQKTHLVRVTLITMIAILPVLVGVPLIFWRYRRGGSGAYRPDFDFSSRLDLAMWGVPTLLIVIMGAWLWHSTTRLDPYRPLGADPIRVQVVGLNWKWLFLYPDQGVASIGVLAVPEGTPVQLSLTTDSVMQSFLVPELAGQIYAMPGMVTQLNFQADRSGAFNGGNTQFNGIGFAHQNIVVEAMPQNDFDAWVKAARKAPSLDAAAYAKLGLANTGEQAQQALGLAGPQMRLGDRELFAAILDRYNSGKAVPASAQPGAPSYKAETQQ